MLSSYKLKSLKTDPGRDNLVNPKEEMPRVRMRNSIMAGAETA